jgi:hypothetical protein
MRNKTTAPGLGLLVCYDATSTTAHRKKLRKELTTKRNKETKGNKRKEGTQEEEETGIKKGKEAEMKKMKKNL